MEFRVFHGGSKKIEAFDEKYMGKGIDQYGSGFYFSDSENVAKSYGDAITKAVVRLNNPIILDGNVSSNLGDVEVSLPDVIKYLKAFPPFYDEDDDTLGDYSEEYWTNPPTTIEERNSLVENVAHQYFRLTSLKHLDILFAAYPPLFLKLTTNILGYDGVVVNFENSSHVIAWRPEQIEII